MEGPRYLVRLAHAQIYQPADQPQLLQQTRALVERLPVTVTNLRVSSRAVEFDCFTAMPVDESLRQSWHAIGPLITWRRLEEFSGTVDELRTMQEARQFFNEERFWEVHEALEPLWKLKRDPEKRWVQGLILAAAAFVHVQRNEPRIVEPMIGDALFRLKDAPDTFLNWPAAAFRVALETSLKNFPIRPFTV
jgi:hypothetical protein